MSWDTAGALLALGATYILGCYSGKAVTLSKVGLTSQMRCLERDVAVNDAADEEELPYRPAAEPYRFTYDTALRDLKPAVPLEQGTDLQQGLDDYAAGNRVSSDWLFEDEESDPPCKPTEAQIEAGYAELAKDPEYQRGRNWRRDGRLPPPKPAVPPTAQVAGEPEPPPATTTLSDRLEKGPW